MGRSGALLPLLLVLVLSFGCGCGKSSPEETTYGHAVMFTVTQLQTGIALSGTVAAKRDGDGSSFSGSFSAKIDLGETKNSKENYSFILTAAGHLPREIKNVPISDNTITANMIDSTVADIAGLRENVIPGGMNDSWVPRNISVRFNPNLNGNGSRLTTDQINGAKDAMEFIKANSKGYIQNITYDENGNDPERMPLNDGEINVYQEDGAGVANSTYPIGGDRVTRGILYFGTKASYAQTRGETGDVFVQGEQGMGAAKGDWYMIMFNRPRGNDNSYIIGTEKETQVGLDNFSMTIASNPQMSYAQNPSSPLSIPISSDRLKKDR